MGKLHDSSSAVGPSSAQSVHSLQLLDQDDIDADSDHLLLDEEDTPEDWSSNDNPPSYDAATSDSYGQGRPTSVDSVTDNNSRIGSTFGNGDTTIPNSRLIDTDYRISGGRKALSVRKTVRNTHIVTLEPLYSQCAGDLAYLMAQQVRLPPRPQLVIIGTHTESSTNHKDNKKQNNTVTDFDFRLDLAETLLTGWERTPTHAPQTPLPTQSWHNAWVATDYDQMKTYRGTRIKTLVWKAGKNVRSPATSSTSDDLRRSDLENNGSYRDEEEGVIDNAGEQDRLIQEGQSDLVEWCTRFCNDPSPVKSFTLIRHVHNFQHQAMIDCIKSHIRETNYRGRITTDIEIVNGKLTIYSPHWVNNLRNNRFVFWICVILQLWIITWPVIWFLEKRYAVVYSCWYSSLTREQTNDSIQTRIYARGRDEHALGEFWAPAVKQAAWARRQDGEVILLEDAQRVQNLTTAQILRSHTRDSQAEIERRQRVDRGDGTFVDSVIGLARGVSEVRQDWNMTMGWGQNR